MCRSATAGEADRKHPSSSAAGSALGKLFISHVLRNARLNRFVRARCRRPPRAAKPFAYCRQWRTFGWLITRRSRSFVDAPQRSAAFFRAARLVASYLASPANENVVIIDCRVCALPSPECGQSSDGSSSKHLRTGAFLPPRGGDGRASREQSTLRKVGKQFVQLIGDFVGSDKSLHNKNHPHPSAAQVIPTQATLARLIESALSSGRATPSSSVSSAFEWILNFRIRIPPDWLGRRREAGAKGAASADCCSE